MSDKLKSRKFWFAIVGAIVLVLNEGLDMGLDRDTILGFAALVLGYIFAEAGVDMTRKK